MEGSRDERAKGCASYIKQALKIERVRRLWFRLIRHSIKTMIPKIITASRDERQT